MSYAFQNVTTCDDVASFRSFPSGVLQKGYLILINGDGSFLDGFPGIYTYDPSSSDSDDGFNVLKQTGVTGNGRAIRHTRFDSLTDIAHYQNAPSDPSTTTSTTGVMMGIAGAITPARTGNVLILVSGTIDNDTVSDGAQAQIRYGTGAAPSNGAALTGTTAGGLVKQVNPSLFSLTPGASPVCLSAIVSGLTVNTAYWVDISLAAISGGTARIRDISISIVEI